PIFLVRIVLNILKGMQKIVIICTTVIHCAIIKIYFKWIVLNGRNFRQEKIRSNKCAYAHRISSPTFDLLLLYFKTMNTSTTGGINHVLHPRTDRPGEPSRPCFVPAIAGGTAGTRRTGIPMETARQLDRPGQQVVSPQPEQGRRPR